MLNNVLSFIRNRPAETTTSVASIIAAAILWALGIKDASLVVPLTVVIGHVPAAVTAVVSWLRKRPARNATKPV